VSGGPDSLALAILADRWARERHGEICALTVDHRLRPESGAEIQQLNAWLAARTIRHEILIWSGEKPATGIQEAARSARYRLLAGWCREHGSLHLLTAHHRDDQIETHLIRRRARSGLDGLAAMSAIRELTDCRILRPLLAFPKDRLVAFLNAEGQPFITDPSNLNLIFERSRLRQCEDVMPATTELPSLRAEIRKLGTQRASREHIVNTSLAQGLSLHPAGFAVFDPKILSTMSRELAERLLSTIVATIGVSQYPARRERIARLRSVLGASTSRAHTLGGCRFVRWREVVLVTRELASAAVPARLSPGECIFWDRRFIVKYPAGGNHSFTSGYLGRAGVAQLGWSAAEKRRSHLPRLLFPILAALWDEHGLAAVPHLGYGRPGLGVLPRFIFRPVHPLTQAGFAVV
jgi:tRNA(Ile)-lysidine synthase